MKQILFIMAIVCGIFAQYDVLAQQRRSGSSFFDRMWIPMNDTIIFKGSKIQIGARLQKHLATAVEIEGFGKSKKSDLEKGFFAIEVSPKKHTTYQITAHIGLDDGIAIKKRTVYVVKSEKEKKIIEEKMQKEKSNSSGIGVGSASFRIMDDETKKDTPKNKTNTSNK